MPASSVMKIAVVLAGATALALAAAATFGTLFLTDDADESAATAPCGDRTFGHISSLKRNGDRYVQRFDPAWFTSGETANAAAAEDGVVAPGEPVPNDHYVVDEGDRPLTYIVPASTPVTVLTREGDPANFGASPISASELAEIVAGEKPIELFEPLDTGV